MLATEDGIALPATPTRRPHVRRPELDPLEGHRVSVTGLIHRDVILIENSRVL